MKLRVQFPLDLGALLSCPIIILAISLLISRLFPVINWLQHPTGLAWLWAFGITTGVAVFGTVLLFLAKLPQYRAGIFLRVGCRHLPLQQQRLYRAAFWLIVPSIFALLALLFASQRFR